MNDDEAAQFIAKHKDFKKPMSFLESMERWRPQAYTCNYGDVSSSGGLSLATEYNPHHQRWVVTSLKLRRPSFLRRPQFK